MKLRDLWPYFTPEVKRALRSSCAEYDRLHTRLVLGALSDLGEDHPVGRILAEVESEAGVALKHPSRWLERPDPFPDVEPALSPCVRETLNFFRVHGIRSITPARLALRLLQIGSGSTVRALEEKGVLRTFLARLEEEAE